MSNVSIIQHETIPTEVTPTFTASAVESQDRIQDLNLMQKAMFKQMTKSLNIPHFGFSEEVIMNECSKLRDSINYSLKKDDLLIKRYGLKKISFMPIFLKAMCMFISLILLTEPS
jgi:2-oxoisovalerate dehydrogenase E2 component (dihydrolipoyl transacylase)